MIRHSTLREKICDYETFRKGNLKAKQKSVAVPGKLVKGTIDKLTLARDRELDYLAELIHQERHCGETDEQFRKRILEELIGESEEEGK